MNSSPNKLDSHLDRLSGKRRPVVHLVILATTIGCMLLVAFASWFIWSSHRTQIRQTEIATTNVARMIGVQVETAMKATTMALANVIERVEHDGIGDDALERLSAHLLVLTETTPELHGMFVYAADGRWLATSLRGTPQGNNADRPYFQHHRNHPGRDIYVGHPVRSRSTGVWVLPISRRIDHPDGSFAGVALVTLKVNFFERIYDELDVGKTGTVLLALDDGTVVYRRPFDEKLIGSDLSNGNIYNALRHRSIGSSFLVAKVDKVERLYSYRRLHDFPFLVAVGRTKDELLGDWQRSSMLIGVAVLLIGAMLAAFATKLIRRIAAQDRLDRKLRMYSEGLERHNVGLRELAHTDKLTQLANRRRFDEVLDAELKRAQRGRTPLSLIMMDLDYFKQFNDRYGHLAGDICLQRAASVLSTQVTRAGDLAARYGGEEFAVIMPNTGEDGAIALAERIRSGLLALRIPHQPSPSRVVTASLGVATLVPETSDNATAGELIERADRHLYAAKQRGRNQVRGSQAGDPAAGDPAAR